MASDVDADGDDRGSLDKIRYFCMQVGRRIPWWAYLLLPIVGLASNRWLFLKPVLAPLFVVALIGLLGTMMQSARFIEEDGRMVRN